MLPGYQLNLVMDIVARYPDSAQSDLTEAIAVSFDEDRALEIVAELSQDTVLQWVIDGDQSYLESTLPCVWCGWSPTHSQSTHVYHRTTTNPTHPHDYDYRIATLP